MKPITQKLADLIRGATFFGISRYSWGKRYWPAKPYFESQGCEFVKGTAVYDDLVKFKLIQKDFGKMFGLKDFYEYMEVLEKKGKKIFDTFNPEIEGK